MCIKRDARQSIKRVFAHVFMLPKRYCEYGSRAHSIVAVSNDDSEFRFEIDQCRYGESHAEMKRAFLLFCRECGVKRGRGEVWYSESVKEEFQEDISLCGDCPKRSCFHFVNDMLCLYSIKTLWLDYEYEKRCFHLPEAETFAEFKQKYGYDAAKEPYAGRDLYCRYKEDIDKEKFTEEECLRMGEFIRNHFEIIYTDEIGQTWLQRKVYFQVMEAVLRLFRDAPALCKNGINYICENCGSKSNEEQRKLFAFLENLMDEYYDRHSAPTCFEPNIWDCDLYRFIEEKEGKIFQKWAEDIRAEIVAEKELWERREAALREFEQKYKTDEPVFGAMYMTPFGTLIDCSMFPNGHADVSAWLNEQGLEIDYRPGEPSQLLHLKGWLRLNTKVGYVEQSDRAITVRQRRRIAETFGEGEET